MRLDWGTVPDWFNVALTTAALLGAVWAGRTAVRAYALEQRRQRIAEERDEAAQASKVAAWVTEQSITSWNAVIRNGSDLPIYDVTLTYYPAQEIDEGIDPVSAHWDVVGPGDTSVPYPENYQWPGGHPITHLVDDLGLTLTFIDAAGVPWRRDMRGHLSCVRGHDSARFLRGPMPGSA